MLSLLSRLASAAAFLWAKGSITYREPWLEILGAAARIAMSDVPRRLLRAGVERSRRFVMLPSFGLSLSLDSHSWILFCDASPLELSEELDCPDSVQS